MQQDNNSIPYQLPIEAGSLVGETPKWADLPAKKEESKWPALDQFERVDINLRENAGNMALVFVFVSWALALGLALFFMVGALKLPDNAGGGALVALIVALFSAPTVIVLAVLNNTKKKQSNDELAPVPLTQVVDAVIKAVKEVKTP